MMRRVRQNLGDHLRELVPALNLRKQSFFEDVLLVSVSIGHGLGDLELGGSRLFGSVVLFFRGVVSTRRSREEQRGKQRRAGWHFSYSHELVSMLSRVTIVAGNRFPVQAQGRPSVLRRARTYHTPKADVSHPRVRAAPVAGARAVAGAVAVVAQERAALLDALRHERPGRVNRAVRSRRIDREPAGALAIQVALVPVGAPFPDVAGHVVEAAAVGRE